MAFVVERPGGRFEVRESRATPRGPRARTLATFATLDDAVVAHVIERAEVPVDVHDLVRAACRAGASRHRGRIARRHRRPRCSPRSAPGTNRRPRWRRHSRSRRAQRRRVRFRARGGGVEWRDPGRAGRCAARPVAALRSTAGAATPAMTEPSLPDKVVALHHALEHGGIAHAFGGALALAYYAEPRTTVDVDVNVFVTADHADDIAAVLAPLGVDTTPLSGPLPAARDRSVAVGDAPRLTCSSPTTRSTRRCARTRSRCRSVPTRSRSSDRSISWCAKRCSTARRTGSTSSRCSPTVDGFDAADALKELERVVGADDPRAARLHEVVQRVLR